MGHWVSPVAHVGPYVFHLNADAFIGLATSLCIKNNKLTFITRCRSTIWRQLSDVGSDKNKCFFILF